MDTKFPAQRDELEATWRQLQRQWETAKTVWNDQQRREFEHNVWLPLARDLERMLHHFEAAGTLMQQAEHQLPKPPGRRSW